MRTETDMHTIWHPANPDDPYVETIERFIGQDFPQLSNGRLEDSVAAIMTQFLATKQFRIGPKPNPESEVMMRDVVRRAVNAERPVPILIASAALKVPIGESIDVAELSALRVLHCLQDRVVRHYAPGVAIRIRLEDLTEYVISRDVPLVSEHITTYVREFTQLVDVLGYSSFITPVTESSLANHAQFLVTADAAAKIFQQYLAASDPRYLSGHLASLGWTGGVSTRLREWLYDRYAKLYPELKREQYDEVLSRYLAAILTRRNMGAVGADKTFDGRLEISFAPALPDTPTVSTRVYYRTVPLSQSSFHAPYWSAKGHIRINNDNEARIALGRWTDTYTQGQLEVIDGEKKVTLRADYVLE